MTEDKQHLFLHLYNGEQFENLKSQSINSKNVPYRRESFREKHIVIEFDGGFNMVDGSFLSSRSDSKNMAQISESIDSLSFKADSTGRAIFDEAKRTTYRKNALTERDSTRMAEGTTPFFINTDSLFNAYTLAEKEKALKNTTERMETLVNDWKIKNMQMADTDKNIRRHQSDWHKKITLSLSCLIFFFIGAPLGAIIRKGGLGLPVVISVIIFVLYYIIDSGSTRVARSGEMDIILGTWMSTLVLAPIGAFFTYKSNKDSVVFNLEMYIGFFRWLLGMRPKRHLFKKEVIIQDPDYAQVVASMSKVSEQCQLYLDTHRLASAPNYYRIFFVDGPSNAIAEISEQTEDLIKELSNSKDGQILNSLNNYPILSTQAHKSPTDLRWLNALLGICIPVGLFFYIRIWMFGRRLEKDLKRIIQTNTDIQNRIKNNSLDI
jgi:lipopolysaccharide export system permease protein